MNRIAAINGKGIPAQYRAQRQFTTVIYARRTSGRKKVSPDPVKARKMPTKDALITADSGDG